MGTLLILGLVGFTIFIIFLYQKKHIAFQQSLESLKLDHEKSLLKTRLEIQEQTFQNISREIHDNIGLALTLAKLNLNILEPGRLGRSKELVGESINLISKSIEDLSDISKSLNSEAIGEQGLINALQLEIERLKRLNRFKLECVVSGTPVYFESQKELLLFRIVQEALNNIIKHAEAKRIILEVCFSSTEVTLRISDDGKGFSYANDKNMIQSKMKAGLSNMKIRASLINGIMRIESVIGKGTTITVTVPLDTTKNHLNANN